ncbi:NAD+ synthase [Nocardiopsis sp. FIRDI 009]|uniref:NAD+ synthase n=1 Tax=Nocardiopsis sp. FIRDI 009 TaxID=714197 RepID=UPI0018E4EB1F|nr:NAD+ synthase [Nocardiopsis sp. FIRDI 009]
MVQLRIALAQINPVVGDLDRNCDSVVAYARQASDAGAHLVVFPEMVVTGYSVEDLALRDGFVSASTKATHRLAERLSAEGLGHLPTVVGFLNRKEGAGARFGQPSGAPQNSLAVLHRGRVRLVSAKHHLPNYGVFDEFRYFVPGDTIPVLRLHGVDIAFAICEDLWQDGGPVAAAAEARAGMLITLNGSPYERHKDDVRLGLCQRRAREIGAAIGYVNMTGGQDDLVFEGDSLIVDADGELVARAAQFEDELLVTDVSLPRAESWADEPTEAGGFRVVRYTVSEQPAAPYETRPPVLTPRKDPLNDLGEVYTALVTGVRDHVRKNGFTSVLVGVSGGVDSALTATIAADAVGAANVHALVSPGRGSDAEALDRAEDLIKRQDLIRRLYPTDALLDALESTFATDDGVRGALLDQARGALLATLSRQEGHLVLATGNKTELATGACAHYGDAVGAYAPLKDCWKTLVWELARWRNAQRAGVDGAPPIPESSLDRRPVNGWELIAPAPERPGYEVLDGLLDAYIGTDQGVAALTAAGFAPDLVRHVVRLVDRAEHKRRQYPPGPKITRRNLGRDRRLPITNRWLA